MITPLHFFPLTFPIFPLTWSLPTCLFYDLSSLTTATHMCIDVVLSTGAWETYSWIGLK